jgi:hypothetical protein
VGLAAALLGVIAVAEGGGALVRFDRRKKAYAAAQAHAQASGRTFVVIGDPDTGMHTRIMRAYGCGDVCLDLTGCPACPRGIAVDLTKGPIQEIPDDSAVVFVGCTLEYVDDVEAATAEILRMAGSPANVHITWVQPWTITATLYPNAKWWLVPEGGEPGQPGFRFVPIPTVAKVGMVLGLGLLVVAALKKKPPKTALTKPGA